MDFSIPWFENDVKMYGIETGYGQCKWLDEFENDVKMYGTETGKQSQKES